MLGAVTLAHDVVHDDEELRIVTWGNVLAARWRATPTKAKLALLGHHQRMFASSTFEGRIVTLTVLSPAASLRLAGDVREQAEAVVKAGRAYLWGSAQVVEGEGFAAAAARAVLSSIQLAVHAGYPIRVFGTIDDAMPWVAELLRKAGHPRDADDAAVTLPRALGLPSRARA
jgi:hypothetical protein